MWTRFKQGFKSYVVAPVSLISNSIFFVGKAAFGLVAFTELLFKNKPNPFGKFILAAGLTSNVFATVLTRGPAVFKSLRSTEEPEEGHAINADVPPERGKFARFSMYFLNTVGIIFGLQQALVAYVTANQGADTLASWFDKTTHESLAQIIPIQLAALVVAISALGAYLIYDQKNLKRNTADIADHIDAGDKPTLKPLFIMLAIGIVLVPCYTGLAFFLADKSVHQFGFMEKIGKIGMMLVEILAASSTAITVSTWLPSVYRYFASYFASRHPQDEFETAEPPAPHPATQTTFAKVLKILTVSSGLGDSAQLGCGMSASIVFTLNTLFKADPYHFAVILLAITGGLSAAVVNYLFGVIPGLENLMQTLVERAENQEPANQTDEETPLMDEDEDSSTEETSPSMRRSAA